MSIRPFSCATLRTASATDEVPRPVIIFTPSTSYHLRAIAEPMSGLVWWSADRISTERPSTLPPTSSIAICIASTSPAVRSP